MPRKNRLVENYIFKKWSICQLTRVLLDQTPLLLRALERENSDDTEAQGTEQLIETKCKDKASGKMKWVYYRALYIFLTFEI